MKYTHAQQREIEKQIDNMDRTMRDCMFALGCSANNIGDFKTVPQAYVDDVFPIVGRARRFEQAIDSFPDYAKYKVYQGIQYLREKVLGQPSCEFNPYC